MRHCSQASPVPSEPAQPIERSSHIFAADVAGYSRLMGQDEAGTMQALTAHREVMDRLIAQHRGPIANTAGDSVLAEFPSVVDAVKCAIAVQETLLGADESEKADQYLRFRIGIHVGDVLVRGAHLLGDGVNVAARLQSLAEPGGYLHLGCDPRFRPEDASVDLHDLGFQNFTNIDEPIHVDPLLSRGSSGGACFHPYCGKTAYRHQTGPRSRRCHSRPPPLKTSTWGTGSQMM